MTDIDYAKLQDEVDRKHWHYQHDLGGGVVTKVQSDWFVYWHGTRRRIFMGVLEERFGPSLAGRTALDIACNSGFWSYNLVDRGAESVLAFDTSPELIENAELVRRCRPDRPDYGRIEFQVGDVYTHPFDERTYDIVLCLGIMYHLTDIVGVARKVRRATGGIALIDSSVSSLTGNVLEISDHNKYFWCVPTEFSLVPTREALKTILLQSGFSSVREWLPSADDPAHEQYGPNGFRTLMIAES